MRPDKNSDKKAVQQPHTNSASLTHCLEARGSCCAPSGVALMLLRGFDGFGAFLGNPLARINAAWRKGRR